MSGYQRKSAGEIIAVAGDEPDTSAIAARHDAEAVVLDFVNPIRTAGGRLAGDGRHGSMKRRVERVFRRDMTEPDIAAAKLNAKVAIELDQCPF